MKIIIDAMGGDNAPNSTVGGAVMAAKEFGLDIILVGNEQKILACLEKEDTAGVIEHIEIVNAAQELSMCDPATSVTKEKKDSSLAVALRLLGEGKGDALVASGNTGAVLVGATMYVKRIRGIRRAALAPILPTDCGGTLLIDCGANVECTSEYLMQFAYMGHAFAKRQMKIENPRVGLVNNGAEESKGTPMVKETYELLKEADEAGRINFIGNVEGRDIAFGEADIVITDGFTGNVLLKTYEGVGLYFVSEIKKMFLANFLTKLAALVMKPQLRAFKKKLDYKETGGAPLLGISKPIIKAHGSCNAYAFRSAIRQAMTYAESGVIEEITANIEHMKAAIVEETEKN